MSIFPGDAALVAREPEGDRVKRAGPHLKTDGGGAAPLPTASPWRRFLHAVRDAVKKSFGAG